MIGKFVTFFALAAVVALFCLAVAPQGAAAEGAKAPPRRVALVVGNAHYRHTPALANPSNDADAMTKTLKLAGFEVTQAKDLEREEFLRVFERFKKTAENAEAALFYFSGHGFQLGGANYLVPIDAALKAKEAIDAETVRLDEIVSGLQSGGRQTLILLDACRNNPLPPDKRVNDGLALVKAGNDVFVAFATQPGNVSYDGKGETSPFTTAFVQNMNMRGLSISDLMIRVRNDVERITFGQQTPWDQSSLKRQFYFHAPEVTAAAAPVAPQSVALAAPLQSPIVPGDIGGAARRTSIDPSISFAALPQALVNPAPETGKNSAAPGQPEPGVIYIPEAPTALFGNDKLVWSVQNELSRVGCYGNDPDGVWGAASREGLIRYYATKKLVPRDTEPTTFLLENLKRESGVVCPALPAARAYVPRNHHISRPSDDESRHRFGRRSKGGATAASRSRSLSGSRAGPVNSAAATPEPEHKSLRDSFVGGAYR